MSLGMQEILPNGGLASFQNHVSRIADLGRYEDAYIVHAAEGETVVPMAVFDENPRLKAMLFAQMRGMGIDPERYIVGNELNSINPVTGQPEFFLKKIFKSAKKALKAVAPYAGLIAGAMGAGPGWSALAGGIGGLYGSEGDLGAGAMGALGGYGAGKAFGTAGWVPGTPSTEGIFGSGDYIFGDKAAGVSSWDQLKSNIGLGGSTAGGKVEATKVLTNNQAAALDVPQGTTFGELWEIGKIKNPASPDEWYGKAMLAITGAGVAGSMLFGEDDENKPVDWGDPYAPWGGNFAAPGVTYTAEGGIINAYDNGGDVEKSFNPSDYKEGYLMLMNNLYPDTDREIHEQEYDNWFSSGPDSEYFEDRKNRLLKLLSNLPQGGFGYESAEEHWRKAYPEQFDEEGNYIGIGQKEGGIINAYDNGGLVDRHPGTSPEEKYVAGWKEHSDKYGDLAQEGYQFDFDVDGENRTYSFDEPGITNEARQAFLAREGITPIAGGIAGALPKLSTGLQDDIHPKGESFHKAYELASALKGGGKFRITSNDLQDAYEMMKTMTPEEIEEIIDLNKFYYSKRSDNQIDDEAYTQDKYADGGIAHLAGGSFPRMSGAIAGPGGPKDDMVPAMLSDGEFVMTADAVRNAGGGNRREGARRMYQLMNQLQGAA